VIVLPARVRHDVPVRAFWRGAAAVLCAVALAGCSVLSGRSTSDATISTRPGTNAPGAAAPRAEFSNADQVTKLFGAARRDFETIYTYDYRDLPKYRNAGLRVTTGSYSTTYRAAFQGRSAQALVAGHFVQVAKSSEAALASLTDAAHAASVIVHGTFSTTSASNPAGTDKSVTVVVGMRRLSGAWRVSSTKTGAAAQGPIPGNPSLKAAIRATRTGLVGIWDLHRTGFSADYDKATSYTVDDLRATMTKNEASLHTTLQKGGYDLSAKIAGLGVTVPGDAVSCIVALDEYRTAKHGAKLGPYHHVFTVTVTHAHGRWLLSSVTTLS
jgi:hypothetical protein